MGTLIVSSQKKIEVTFQTNKTLLNLESVIRLSTIFLFLVEKLEKPHNMDVAKMAKS